MLSAGENEANVRYILDTFPFMKLVPQTPHLGGTGISGEVTLPGARSLRLRGCLPMQTWQGGQLASIP